MPINSKLNQYARYEVRNDDTLLEWMLKNIQGSKTKIKAILAGHGVSVNDEEVTQFDFALHKGDVITLSKSKQNETFKSPYLRIVYEDKWLIIIDKNIGILSMANQHATSLNVKAVLDDYLQRSHQHCTSHVVHRLDRDTSGLMVYAKDMATEQILENNWHDIVYERRYVAVVSGVMKEDSGTVANWLKGNKAYITFSSPVDNGGKYAVTHFHTLERSRTHSLVEYRLETGRKNQIRVHSADMGHPVCGDIKYGNGDNPINRLCLHAYVLCFHHPVTHKPMEFRTPIPPAFEQLFRK